MKLYKTGLSVTSQQFYVKEIISGKGFNSRKGYGVSTRHGSSKQRHNDNADTVTKCECSIQASRKEETRYKMVAGLNQRKNNEQKRPCYHCGKKGHAPHNCKFKEAKCFSCGKMGHVSAACRGKSKQRQVVNQRLVVEDNDEIEHFLNWLNNNCNGSGYQKTANQMEQQESPSPATPNSMS